MIWRRDSLPPEAFVVDIIYRFARLADAGELHPASASAARDRLVTGNDRFVRLFDTASPETTSVISCDLSEVEGEEEGSAPHQSPFAAILGCSDARVPTELVFGQAFNELFVVRVAGNVLGSECLGSIDYAVAHFDDLRLLVVLGHSGCGAVKASVDAFLTPANYLSMATSHALRTVVDRIAIAVRGGIRALETEYGPGIADHPGYRAALEDTTVVVHAALTAHTLAGEFGDHAVAFGVYDLVTRRVGLLDEAGEGSRLVDPPRDRAEFAELLRGVITSHRIRALLAT